MTDHPSLSRREILAGLGTVGAGAVLGGRGTAAFFSDAETFENNRIVAGSTDLVIDWQQTVAHSAPVDVNAYPDPDGDGVQSLGGVEFSGATGTVARSHQIPDVCGDCGEGQLALRQGDRDVCIDVVRGAESVEAFYDYRGPSGSGDYWYSSGNETIQAPDASRLFVYEEPSGDRYLVVIHGEAGDGERGSATFVFDGLESAAGSDPWILQDDDGETNSPDEYSSTEATWGWKAGKTDGGVAGPLEPAPGHDGFCLTIDPTIGGLSNLQVLDGDVDSAMDLDPTAPLTICSRTGLESGTALAVPDVYQSDIAPDQQSLVELTDVKPGDEGGVTFSLHTCEMDSYVWLFAENVAEAENGVTEPEADDPQEDGTQAHPGSNPELGGLLQARVWYDEDCNETLDGSETTILEGSLREVLGVLAQVDGVPGVPLDGDPSTPYDEVVNGTVDDGVDEARECVPAGSTTCVGLEWWFPVDHANEAQTDSISFDLGFYCEQCSANDGDGMAPETTTT